MRALVYIIVFFIGQVVIAQNDALFTQGNTYYNEGKFQEAIQLYEKVLESDQHSAELYFNLANAYYKTNQIAPSIYYYEKALILSPNDSDIINNLTFAQNMTIDDIAIIPEVGFKKLYLNAVNTFRFDTWAMLAVSFGLLFVIMFLWYYFSFQTNRKRLMFLTSFSALFLALVSLTFAFQKFKLVQKDNPAIVFVQESHVKTEPNLRSENAFDLHQGTKVQVLENYNDNWVKIKLSDGKTGWILSTDIKVL